jgi:hypothetical protein
VQSGDNPMHARKARSDCCNGRMEGTNRVTMWRARFAEFVTPGQSQPNLTSCPSPTIKTPLAGSNTIHPLVSFAFCHSRSTVFTVQSILLLCAVRESAATYTATSPTTHIAATKRNFSATHLIATHLIARPWRRSPASHTRYCCAFRPATFPCIHNFRTHQIHFVYRICELHSYSVADALAHSRQLHSKRLA